MPKSETVPAQLAQALSVHANKPALVDAAHTFSYGQLGASIERLAPLLPKGSPVAIFGSPAAIFGAAATAAVVLGRPFVHLDPEMPREVLANIVQELAVEVVLCCQPPKPDQIPATCLEVDVRAALQNLPDAPARAIIAADVQPEDYIYIVATSGTTGKPKCIPVTHDAAYLSYEWRDAYTPYGPHHTVGIYIFAIWEMFRPLRNGAKLCFPEFSALMTPSALRDFLEQQAITEMLFTPSALEKTLQGLVAETTKRLPLQRIVLNGEVVSDDLIAAVQAKLPQVELWNLYSICETHDISMTQLKGPQGNTGAISVGVPMPHLKAVVLDDHDRVCPVGQPGLLHFEGPRMLGPGFINRAEETALRFRTIEIEGRATRVFDAGDQGYVGRDGAVHVMGRIAHMLKLRGHSIQTRELVESLHGYLAFGQGVPWVQEIEGQGAALVIYYTADSAQAAQNARDWGIESAECRLPATLSKALRRVLPAYCVPSYLVRLEALPLNPVSGKCDLKALPKVTALPIEAEADADVIATMAKCAEVMGCSAAELEAELSFHEQGGDSLMAVSFVLALEAAYGCRVDFDFALHVPLARLHAVLSETGAAAEVRFERKGILLTGVTGFLGSRVLAAAAKALPDDQVIYCVIRSKRTDAAERLAETAAVQGVDPARLVLISAAIEDAQFGLATQSYQSLAACVRSVIHCAAMVNLAVDSAHMTAWSQGGIRNILAFCEAADADLRFSSTSAVYPDTGGPHPERATQDFEGSSGYGAAKIAAEQQIAASGIRASIVRLPSLYDLTHPNPNDIYETILSACAKLGAQPEGLAFRMIDVHRAAEFLVGVARANGAEYYNLAPEVFVVPDALTPVPTPIWLRDASLSDGERALIASDLRVLCATATLEHGAARATWGKISESAFEAISEPQHLINARLQS